MKIMVNESWVEYFGTAQMGALRDFYKPGADVLLCNGGMVGEDYEVTDSDRVVLIKRGEKISLDEMNGLMRARNPREFTECLGGATVAICGCGGLGSLVAMHLARSMVKSLILIDFDVVEPSNLNRQQYFTDQLGKYKVEALRENLVRINPYLEIEEYKQELTELNAVEILCKVDIVAECFDRADCKAMLVMQVLKNLKSKIVAVSGIAGYKDCDRLQVRKMRERFWLVGDGISAAKPGSGLTAAKVGIAASMQAAKIVELLIEDADKS